MNVTKVEITLLAVLLFLSYTVATKNRFTFDDVAFSIHVHFIYWNGILLFHGNK